MRLDEKPWILWVVHSSVRLDTSLRDLPDDNLNHLKKRSLQFVLRRWANRKPEYKRNLMMCKGCCVSLCLWCYYAFHKVTHVDNPRERVEGIINKVR